MEVINLSSDIEKFVKSLEKPTISKIARTVNLLERFGYRLTLPHSKNIAHNLFELRIRGQQEVRIFYVFRSGNAILLSGFVKKTQKTPQSEISKALKLARSLMDT